MTFSILQSGRENWTGNATVRRRGSSLSDEMKGRCYCSVVTLAMAMAALALSSPLASLLLSFCCFLFLSLFTIYSFFPSTFTLFSTTQNLESSPNFPTTSQTSEIPKTVQSSGLLKVYVVDLPREFNYGLLEQYYNRRRGRQKLWFEEGEALDWGNIQNLQGEFLPYPENPTWKQYSAEYWLLADLMTDGAQRGNSPAVRVMNMEEAEIFFVPFFAALSAEIQLGEGRGNFRHKVQENGDYVRQLAVLDFVMKTEAWQRSGGRDHVFVLTDPMAMWHARAELARSILLVVDFGGWYMEDARPGGKDSICIEAEDVIHHTKVSLTKDVIVPYTHLLPSLDPSMGTPRDNLLYFRGARHRHRTGLIRDKLWEVIGDEPGVIFEEGFPNSTGREQALKGMRRSHFCLNPAGDTPTSSRLFDSIASLCIPVIVSDTIELPFEGLLDYKKFSVFISVANAMTPKFILQHLENVNSTLRESLRARLATVKHHFEYDNGVPGGRGPMVKEGAVSLIWRKVKEKIPYLQMVIIREHRKIKDSSFPSRCLCM